MSYQKWAWLKCFWYGHEPGVIYCMPSYWQGRRIVSAKFRCQRCRKEVHV